MPFGEGDWTVKQFVGLHVKDVRQARAIRNPRVNTVLLSWTKWFVFDDKYRTDRSNLLVHVDSRESSPTYSHTFLFER